MQVKLHNDTSFYAVITAIENDPVTWDGWNALLIPATLQLQQEGSEEQDEGIISSISTTLNLYLGEREGSTFLTPSGDILILCKKTDYYLLEEVGLHICDLLFAHTNHRSEPEFFKLYPDYSMLLERLQERLNNIPKPKHKAITQDNRVEEQQTDRETGGKLILVVDDDPLMYHLIHKALNDRHHVSYAKDAQEAGAVFSRSVPDLTLLDIQLPDVDGLELLEYLLEYDQHANVVMLSGNDTIDNLTQALENGAKGFLPKPLNKHKLMHYVSEAYSS